MAITADSCKYTCVEDSVASHSACLLGAMKGRRKWWYKGLAGCTDYKKAVQIKRTDLTGYFYEKKCIFHYLAMFYKFSYFVLLSTMTNAHKTNNNTSLWQ